MSKGLVISDVIRSMMRMGFPHDEIYDVLSGAGVPGEHVQLLIDRISAEFHDMGIEPQTSRLAREIQDIFKIELEETLSNILSHASLISREIISIKTEMEKLNKRVIDLQRFVRRANSRSKTASG